MRNSGDDTHAISAVTYSCCRIYLTSIGVEVDIRKAEEVVRRVAVGWAHVSYGVEVAHRCRSLSKIETLPLQHMERIGVISLQQMLALDASSAQNCHKRILLQFLFEIFHRMHVLNLQLLLSTT